MKLDVKIELLRFFFAIFNSVFLVLGLSVFGCGVWILFGSGSFLNVLSSEELRVVAAGLFFIGLLVFAVSVSGCVGAIIENRFLLLVYVGFLIVLVLGQLFVTLLLLLNRNKVEKSLNESVDHIIYHYGNDSSLDRIMDSVQHSAKCCGRTSPADWLNNAFIQSLGPTSLVLLPCSCFSSFKLFNSPWCSDNGTVEEPLFGKGYGAFNESCSQKLSDWLRENILTVVGMDVGLIFIQVVNLVLVVFLYQTFGEKSALKRRHRLVDQDHSHSDQSPDADPDYGEENQAYIDGDGGHSDLNTMNHGGPNHLANHWDDQDQDQLYQELRWDHMSAPHQAGQK